MEKDQRNMLIVGNNKVGETILDIAVGVMENVLSAIDNGASTEQIRASLERVKRREAIIGQDTRFFVLGLSQKP